MVVCGDKLSPVIHLRLMAPNSNQASDNALLDTVANSCTEQGVAVVLAKFLSDEMSTPPSRYNCMLVKFFLTIVLTCLYQYQVDCVLRTY